MVVLEWFWGTVLGNDSCVSVPVFSNNSITFALKIRVAVLIGVETASDVGALLYHGIAVLAAVSGNVAFLRRHWCSARLMRPEAE